MTATEVYWMSLVSAYNQALCHRDAAQRTASTNRLDAWVGAGLSVLITALSLTMSTGAEAAPVVCGVLVAVMSVLSGMLAKAARTQPARQCLCRNGCRFCLDSPFVDPYCRNVLVAYYKGK